MSETNQQTNLLHNIFRCTQTPKITKNKANQLFSKSSNIEQENSLMRRYQKRTQGTLFSIILFYFVGKIYCVETQEASMWVLMACSRRDEPLSISNQMIFNELLKISFKELLSFI